MKKEANDEIDDDELEADELETVREPVQIKQLKITNTEVMSRIEKLERNINNLRKQFSEEIEDTKKVIQDINISRINELYSSIDLWTSDVSEGINSMTELGNEIGYFLQNREKIRGKPGLTTDDYIQYQIKMMAELRLKIYDMVHLLNEKTLAADEVKRKINILLS